MSILTIIMVEYVLNMIEILAGQDQMVRFDASSR